MNKFKSEYTKIMNTIKIINTEQNCSFKITQWKTICVPHHIRIVYQPKCTNVVYNTHLFTTDCAL